MVSCQWRLTSGARAGQACGKGKAVFCKTHAPMAERELKNIFGNWRNNPATEYLSWQDKEAKRLLFPPKRANSSNYQYRSRFGPNNFGSGKKAKVFLCGYLEFQEYKTP